MRSAPNEADPVGRAKCAASERRPGRIGPNAVTRVAQSLEVGEGIVVCREIFGVAGLRPRLVDPPTEMVDEREVARLHAALILRLGPARAGEIAKEAGRLTGDYLLANRIPRAFLLFLRLAPRRVAARFFAAAIARHAWTFCGSGRFTCVLAEGLRLTVSGSPICRRLRTEAPACHYYAGTFERLFAATLGPGVRVVETACEAAGAAECHFEVTW